MKKPNPTHPLPPNPHPIPPHPPIQSLPHPPTPIPDPHDPQTPNKYTLSMLNMMDDDNFSFQLPDRYFPSMCYQEESGSVGGLVGGTGGKLRGGGDTLDRTYGRGEGGGAVVGGKAGFDYLQIDINNKEPDSYQLMDYFSHFNSQQEFLQLNKEQFQQVKEPQIEQPEPPPQTTKSPQSPLSQPQPQPPTRTPTTATPTKNLIKSLTRTVLTYLQHQPHLHPTLSHNLHLNSPRQYYKFMGKLKQIRNSVHSIEDLKGVWADPCYGGLFRTVFQYYLRRYGLEYAVRCGRVGGGGDGGKQKSMFCVYRQAIFRIRHGLRDPDRFNSLI